jgi:dCTP deaminase
MTVLGNEDIVRSIERGEISATRGGEKLSVEPASMDLHLGRKLKYPTKRNGEPVCVAEEKTYPTYSEVDTPFPLVREDTFALATTEETISIPNDTVAILHGRSSVGRLGLFIENAGLIDPGFEGQVTLELTNAADYPIELEAGMRIGQLTFHDVKTAPEVGYSDRNVSKYDGQSGPTESRLWEDFE